MTTEMKRVLFAYLQTYTILQIGEKTRNLTC